MKFLLGDRFFEYDTMGLMIPSGIVNIREEANLTSKIIGRHESGIQALFLWKESNDIWIPIARFMLDTSKNILVDHYGYIHYAYVKKYPILQFSNSDNPDTNQNTDIPLPEIVLNNRERLLMSNILKWLSGILENDLLFNIVDKNSRG